MKMDLPPDDPQFDDMPKTSFAQVSSTMTDRRNLLLHISRTALWRIGSGYYDYCCTLSENRCFEFCMGICMRKNKLEHVVD